VIVCRFLRPESNAMHSEPTTDIYNACLTVLDATQHPLAGELAGVLRRSRYDSCAGAARVKRTAHDAQYSIAAGNRGPSADIPVLRVIRAIASVWVPERMPSTAKVLRRMLQEALTEITSCATTRHLRDAVAAAFVPVISEGPLT